MNKSIEPMLAASFPRHWTEEQIWKRIEKELPLIVQPKLDGIRCIIGENHQPLTRQGNLIPNRWIRQQLYDLHLPFGLDGELLCYDKEGKVLNFNATSSAVMGRFGTPIFKYHVFDSFERPVPLTPVNAINEHILHQVVGNWFKDVDALKLQIQIFIDGGYEGAMLRKPNSIYKHSRSTLNEFLLVKLKPFERATGTVIQCIEAQHNIGFGTDQSKRRSNLRPMNILGSLLAKSPAFKELFNVGTGFTDEERDFFWKFRDAMVGKQFTFKYQANRTTKDRPISPVFEGIIT